MNRSLFLLAALVLGTLPWLGGCSGDNSTDPPPPVSYDSLAISAPSGTLFVSQSQMFTAVAFDTAGTPIANPQVSWSSSNELIALVNSAGVVTGAGIGITNITASGGGAVSDAVPQIVVQGVGWVSQLTPVVTHLRGVHFFDASNGWAVGDIGVILHTENGGITWEQQQSNLTGFTLNSVFFKSDLEGYVVGRAGQITRTFDGGGSWQQLTGQPTGGLDLNEIRFFDQDTGVIVGDQGIILVTTDGGDEWDRLLPGITSLNLFSAFVAEDSLAWIVGANGTIISTRDAGDNFNIVTPTVTSQNLTDVWRLSNTQAIAVGANNTVLNTVASGDSAVWQLAPPPGEFVNFGGVSWPVAAAAYAVGLNAGSNATVLKSDDGGMSWAAQVLPDDQQLSGRKLNDVWFVSENVGWTVGDGGLIFQTVTGGE